MKVLEHANYTPSDIKRWSILSINHQITPVYK